MKTTIDVPDDLYRRVKTRAASLGIPVREVTIDLYQRWLGEAEASATPARSSQEWLDEWLIMGAALVSDGDGGPTAHNIITEDRGRLDRR